MSASCTASRVFILILNILMKIEIVDKSKIKSWLRDAFEHRQMAHVDIIRVVATYSISTSTRGPIESIKRRLALSYGLFNSAELV